MKHLVFRLALLGLATPLRLSAQATDTLHQQLDYVLAPLDRSQVLTGRLADYAYPYAPLTYFTGNTLADSTRTNPSLWRALHAST